MTERKILRLAKPKFKKFYAVVRNKVIEPRGQSYKFRNLLETREQALEAALHMASHHDTDFFVIECVAHVLPDGRVIDALS